MKRIHTMYLVIVIVLCCIIVWQADERANLIDDLWVETLKRGQITLDYGNLQLNLARCFPGFLGDTLELSKTIEQVKHSLAKISQSDSTLAGIEK